MKKLSIALVLSLMLSLLCACGSSSSGNSGNNDPIDLGNADAASAIASDEIDEGLVLTKEYSLDCGATFTAESGMSDQTAAPMTAIYANTNMGVSLLNEYKQPMGYSDMTLEEYAAILVSANGFPNAFETDSEGNLSITYTKTLDGVTYYYYTTVHETNTSFWMCSMFCAQEDQSKYQNLFAEWSATLTLVDTEYVAATISETTHSLSCGMEVTAPDDMIEYAYDGFIAVLMSNDAGYMLSEEEKYEGWTLEDYAAALAEANGIPFEQDEYGNWAAAFTSEANGITYVYYITCHETDSSFLMSQFYCTEGMYETYGPYFPAWSASLNTNP